MLKCNWIDFYNEIKKNELLTNEVEKQTRNALLDKIRDAINNYQAHIVDYNYQEKKQNVIQRGVEFISQNNATVVKAKWGKLFASQVDKEIKKKVYYSNYRWHLFSFEILNALTKSKARQAFNRCKKTEVYAFYQHTAEAFLIKNPQLLKSSDFDMDYDIYIFDTVEKWTYIHTHEVEQCGPYFYRVK